MSKDIRVFIASPGGLEAERKAFHDVIDEYNIGEVKPRNIHFYPVGWEISLGGVTRPQEEINKLVRECDYLILLLHDKWGSSTGKKEFLSGSHEEYCIAIECYEAGHNMKNVIVFFKGLSPERIADPGPVLTKVLDFKRQLQDEKKVYYRDIDDLPDFEKHLRRHLADWLRGHEARPEEKTVIAKKEESISQPLDQVSFSPEETELIEKANKYADEGKLLEAEEHFARAIVKGNNPAAFNDYGFFLKRIGRLSQAMVMFERVLELAKLNENEEWQAAVYGNMGIIYNICGDLDKAEEMYCKSLKIAEKLSMLGGMTKQYGNLGITYKARGDLKRAEEMFYKSIEIGKQLGNLEDIASSYGNLGGIYLTQGDLERSEQMLLESLKIERKLGRQEGIASDYSNLGSLYYAQGNLEKAEEMIFKSLKISENLGLQAITANLYGNLGILYRTRGDLNKAVEMHFKSLEIAEKLGLNEITANQCDYLGLVYRTQDNLNKAEEMHFKSLEINKKLNRLEGISINYSNLGALYEEKGEPKKAKEYWQKALDLFKKIGMPHMIAKVQGWLDELED